MGHHDPLDGFITCIQLQTTAAMLPGAPNEPDLKDAVADFATLIEGRDWATADPLGLGGLLVDACCVERLMNEGTFDGGDLLDTLLAAAFAGLSHYSRQGDLRKSASRRLAFRELGLAIGISAIERTANEARAAPGRSPRNADVHARIEALTPYLALGSAIESFWRDPEHRQDAAWAEHRDINDVMLATCLVPEGRLLMPATR
jgi:hypothetical protein